MEHVSRGHLDSETLARLVDDVPSPTERTHLNRCRRCRDELDALQVQTLGLSHLPDLRPPQGDWDSLEPRLRAEGLIRADHARPARQAAGGTRHVGGSARARRRGDVAGWTRWAAAVVLLLGGAGLGAGAVTVLGDGVRPGGSSVAGPGVSSAARDLAAVPAALGLWGTGGPASAEEAEELVRLTESWYRSALLRYREEAGRGWGDDDPLTRYIALEALLAAGQAALTEAPTDPFLNGLLVNMQAEREAALRGIRTVSQGEGEWF
ncbi:hypothetical protein BH23GEM11_BH23GEM11_15610 [soil metagenome]